MNGYELVRMQEYQVDRRGDTMTGNLTMAGNAEVVGNATSSTKLKDARTFTIGNAQPKSFDGTQNLTWTLQEIGAGAGGGGINATYKTTVNANQWQVNGANYKFLVTHNLNSNIIHVGGIHATTNESIFVPYKIINNNSLEVYTFDNTLSIKITVISEALAAGGGGGGVGGGTTSITTGGQVYREFNGNITLPDHLPLTGGTVTGATTFQAGVTIGNTSRITEQAGGLNISSPSITLGGGDIYIKNPMRFVGHGLSDNDGNWSISQAGIATFKGVNAHNDLVCSGTVAGKDGVGGVDTWTIHRDGSASFKSLKVVSIENNQVPSAWLIDNNGDATFNNITAKGVINGKGRIALNNGNIHLPQGGGGTTCDHLRLGGGIMACKNDGNFHFLTSNADPSPIYCKNVIASVPFSLNPIATHLGKSSVFDEINSIDVVETENGLTLVNPTQTLDNKSVDEINDAVFTTVDEKTGDTITNINQNSVIATLWKANQELISKIESLQEEVEKLKGGN